MKGYIIKPELVTAQVSRIVKTEQFRNSRILSGFLKYIVKETLDGNEQSLKEYVIATEVLKKSSDFNPQLDAVVRIHARRLRQILTDYYLDSGVHDPIKITIPKGRYIPKFERNLLEEVIDTEEPLEEAFVSETIPTIAVLPFDCMEGNPRGSIICSVMGRDITIALSYFEHLKVISNHSGEFARENLESLSDIVAHLGADYIISGGCMRDSGNLKVNVELHQVRNKEIIWAETYKVEDFDKNEIKGYETIVKKVVAKSCGYFGIIYRNKLHQLVPKEYDTLYAIYWHNRYHRNFSMEAYQETSQAIDRALSVNPDNALLTAFKAELILNLCSMDMEGDMEYFRQGSDLISRALVLDQKNQHVWQVYSWMKLLDRNKLEFDRAAEKCLSINPYNPMYLGTIGFGYQCSGRNEEGLDLMLESIDLNPYYHWLINLGLCLYYIHKENYEEAAYWAKLINRSKHLWDPLLRVAVFGLLNKKEEAAFALAELLDHKPNFHERATYIVGRFIIDQELQNSILRGLSQAGVEITK